VFKVSKENTVDRVPFLGDIPIVGYLFSHRGELNKKSELLIFITPKIITSNINAANNELKYKDAIPLKGEG
jgi:type IV pilus assembly protein PilQ